MSAKGVQRHSWTECLAIGLCPLFLRFGWTPTSVRFTRPGTPFGARPPSSRLRLDAASLHLALSLLPQGGSRRQSAKILLADCLLRPTKRGGARRKTSLAGRGYAPHCGTGRLGALYRLGAIFPCGSPHPHFRPLGRSESSKAAARRATPSRVALPCSAS